MISFKILGDEAILVTVINSIQEKEFKKIYLVADALFDGNFSSSINFIMENKTYTQYKILFDEFCQNFPYNFSINKF